MAKLKKDIVTITILISVIVISGCIDTGSSQDTEDEGVTAIERVDKQVTPTSISTGDTVDASLTLKNNGNTNAELIVSNRDDGDNMGRAILESYCPDLFRLQTFSVTQENTGVTDNPERSYTLEPEEEISLSWTLEQAYEERISFYKDSGCEVSFTAPFEYSVEGFQQLQIRDNDDLDAPDLESRTSRGPMLLEIDTIGSSSQHSEPYFNEEDFNPEYGGVDAEISMINQIPEEGPRGIVDAEVPEIEFIGQLSDVMSPDEKVPNNNTNELTRDDIENLDEDQKSDRCGVPETIYLYGGDSTIIGCDLTVYNQQRYANSPELDLITGRSSISEIRVTADYKYNAPMGSETVQINFRGEN